MTEIDQLLDLIETPPADAADDVARGERALRRRRRWQVAAAALSVAALAGAGVAATGSHGSPGAQPAVTDQPGASTSSAGARHDSKAHRRYLADQRAKRRALTEMPYRTTLGVVRDYRAVLAEHLDPQGDLIAPPSNVQSGTDVLGTKLDWRDGGMLEIVVGRTWQAASAFYPLEQARLEPYPFPGREVGVSTAGDDLVASVRHLDGTVVTLIASTSFGNNGTSTAGLGLTPRQLLEAAADPRLVLPPGL